MSKNRDFLKDTKILLNSIEGEINEGDTSEGECNSYVKQIEDLKEDLSYNDQDWIDTYSYIEKLGGLFNFSDITKREIQNKLKEIKSQLLKIYRRLGGNLEDSKIQKSNNPMVQVFQTQNQTQYQQNNSNISINQLKIELEEELNKRNPNQSRIKRILEDIFEFGKSTASNILSSILLKLVGF